MSTEPFASPGAPSPAPHPAPPDPPELPEGVVAGPRWPAWMSVAALATGMFGAILGGLLVVGIGAIFGADTSDTPPSVDLSATVVQDAALIGAALLFAHMAPGRLRAGAFGLRPSPFWRSLGWIVLGYLVFIAFSAAWVAALSIESEDDLLDELGVDESTVALVAVMVLVTVVAPIAEELFFRGFFFTALRGWAGVWGAAAICGLFFGGIHAGGSPIGFLVPLAFFGFVLCIVYWKTGSLYPCIALHAINNSLAFGTSEKWDWQIPLLAVGALAACALVLAPIGGLRVTRTRPAA